MTTARERLLGITGSMIASQDAMETASQYSPTPMATTWLDYEREDYAQNAERWQTTLDAYTGDIIDQDRVNLYLVRRTQGESIDAFIERAALADWPGHMATIIDSLAGMLSHQEEDTVRVLNDGKQIILGAQDERESHFGRLWQNADGRGTGWNTLHKQLAVQVTLLTRAWGLVDRAKDRDPTVRYLSPLVVPDHVDGEHGPVEVKLVERVDVRTTVKQKPEKRKRWVLYTLDGWFRYEKITDSAGQSVEKEIGRGAYDYFDRDQNRCLPIFPVQLPLGRDVGWLMAKRWIAHFNALSALDHLLRFCNFPKLNLVAADETEARKLIALLREGWNTLWNPPGATMHEYIAPPSESAAIALSVLQDRVKDIYISAFQSYGDAAAQAATATEINQDVESGVAAFLQMLVAGVDDAENRALRLVTQTIHPAKPKWWDIPHVQRSNKFTPRDADAIVQKTIDRVFGVGKVVPLGVAAKLAAAKQVADYTGLEYDEAQLKAETELRAILDVLETVAGSNLPMPGAVRAELAIKLWGAFGLIDAEKVIEMADGTQKKLIEVVRKEMEDLAKAEDDAKLREAEATPTPEPIAA